MVLRFSKRNDNGRRPGSLRLTQLLVRTFRVFPPAKRETVLEPVIADLESLNRSTERDFLAVGGKLMEFLAAARQISLGMAALGDLIAGEQGRHATLVLTRVLEESRACEARAAAGDEVLAYVRGAIRRIENTFRGFRDTVASFRVLGSLTRIETARLGGAGADFGNLAEEVKSLTGSIESHGLGILAGASSLDQNMRSVITQVSGLRAGELKELPVLIGAVLTGLQSFAELQERVREASRCQVAGYAEVTAAIEDLVSAIQFHDLTRQKIEHVVDALRGLQPDLRDAGPVAKLQAAQLLGAEQVFGSSIGRIERNLDGISGRVAAMAEASQTLLGRPADEPTAFFLEMEHRFTGILRILGACSQAEAETQSVLVGLGQQVAGMRDSANELREIEIRMRRMAVNAMVRAAQIGSEGNALHVLAEVMQRLASDSNRITNELTVDLDAIAGAAERLAGGDTGTPGTASGAAAVLAEMRATIAEMQTSGEASFSRLREIAALSANLRNQIQTLRSGFSAGKMAAETIYRCCAALEKIGGPAGSAMPPATGLADLSAHYTMQAERDVHLSLAPGALPESPVPAMAACEDSLGDNVELF